MWYCTVCGKRNISDETKLTCDKCAETAKELAAKGKGMPSLFCHSCGNKNKSEPGNCERCNYNKAQSGSLVIERGDVKVLFQKIDTLQLSIDRLRPVFSGEKANIPDRDVESEKELHRSRHTTEEIRINSDRVPCPECNTDGNNPRKGKCKYCDGAGGWPCRKCGGEGVVRDSVVGIFTDDLPKCPKCHGGKWFGCGLCDTPATDMGDGKMRPGDGLCRRCHGTGYL